MTSTTEPSSAQDGAPPAGGPLSQVQRLWVRWRLGQRLGLILIAAAITASLLTYAVFSGSVTFLPPTPSVLLALLNLDLALFLAVGVLVILRVIRLWGERRRGMAASGLHVRLVTLFSLVAGVPAVLVTTFSVVFLQFGLQGWFSQQVDQALQDSLTIADAYLHENGRAAARDAVAIATEFSRQDNNPENVFSGSPDTLNTFLARHLRWRGLEAAVVFSADGNVFARVGELASMADEIVPEWAVRQARGGEIAVVVGRTGEQLRALAKLEGEPERFLYVARAVDKEVLRYVGDVRNAVSRFQRLQSERGDIALAFGAIFAVLSLMLVLLAIWFGLAFAGRLARPIAGLVGAAERVRAGDLEVRLADMHEIGEFQILARAFNRMTTQLRAQRQELVEANRQLDQRRRFTEAVLAGVAAGVVGLDRSGRIRFPNRTASQLLDTDLDAMRDRELAEVLPAVGPLIERAYTMPAMSAEAQIHHRTDEGERTFLVRITAEAGGNSGSVATFTDITELLDAQRKAAWSDIARRIAHEIKNPLTPIQLSAERLKRRYLPQVEADPDTFQLCTDTIVRQVDTIRRLVDEFSSFARLPAPEFATMDLSAAVREAVSLQQASDASLNVEILDMPASLPIVGDAGQIGQVLTNLLKNAAEAIERRKESEGQREGQDYAASPAPLQGWIGVHVAAAPRGAVVRIADNGAGLPGHLRHRLVDPYVTTRAKGTGLGLAIVQKIVTDHGGQLELRDRPEGGAEVSMTLAAGVATEGPSDGT